jgi:hypothetical protein
VYVDGCFWHSCPEHATVPKNNREWWVEKLAANVARDRDTDRQLREAGWRGHPGLGTRGHGVGGRSGDAGGAARSSYGDDDD